MSSVVTFWYDVYSKTTHLDEVTIGIKKDYTPHYLYLLLYVFFNFIQRLEEQRMKAAIKSGSAGPLI